VLQKARANRNHDGRPRYQGHPGFVGWSGSVVDIAQDPRKSPEIFAVDASTGLTSYATMAWTTVPFTKRRTPLSIRVNPCRSKLVALVKVSNRYWLEAWGIWGGLKRRVTDDWKAQAETDGMMREFLRSRLVISRGCCSGTSVGGWYLALRLLELSAMLKS
jgi:hypothetical protein